MGARPGIRATINGVTYPVNAWELVQAGQEVEEVWDDGFARGIGTGRQQYWTAQYMDPSSPPYIRLENRKTRTIAIANLAPSTQCFAFRETSPNGTAFLYLLNGRYSYKIKISDGTIAETKDHGVNTVLGRPALFEGKWYFPLGGTNDALELTTIDNLGADIYTSLGLGVTALHFAAGMKDGTAQLARAHSTNLIDLASNITPDAADWSPADDAEVGDDSEAISDLVPWQGEWAVVKPNSVYTFDGHGVSRPLQEFVSSIGIANSTKPVAKVLGPYLYWPHPPSDGLWRFFGRAGRAIGYNNAIDFSPDQARDIGGTGAWNSVDAYGNWLYAVKGRELFMGWILDDGSVIWHGQLLAESGTARVFITEGATSGVILWYAYDGNLVQIDLQNDGSMKTALDSNRGRANFGGYQFILPETDLGTRYRTKQLRAAWAELENWVNTVTLTLRVFRDGSTGPEQVGSTYASTASQAFHETAFTPGTNDTARRVSLGVLITTAAGYDPATSDPRIRSLGIRALTPSIYAIEIPVTSEGLKATGQSKATVLDALRDLVNGTTISIVEPDMGQGAAVDTFTGRIVGYRERVVPSDQKEGQGYIVTLLAERYDFYGA